MSKGNSLQYAADQDRIEQVVDSWNVETVLLMLETVCYEKAEHLRTNWQDPTTAKQWERCAARIARCAHAIDKIEP